MAVAALALVLGGCGSGGHSASRPLTNAATGGLVRAADVTTQAPGYRLAGTATLAVSGAAARTIHENMTGSYDRLDRTGAITTTVSALGHVVRVPELISQLTVYMASAAVPSAASLAQGKPWLEIDMSRALGGAGLSSLPTATDPSQFVDYLRAVSSTATEEGTATIRGVPTTHYHTVVDLDRYPSLVAPAQRAAVETSVKNLEAALGSHALPLDVWIDSHHLVRQVKLNFGECVSGTHFTYTMTIDLYDYGPQTAPRLPAPNQVYNLTPLVQSALSRVKLGCAAH